MTIRYELPTELPLHAETTLSGLFFPAMRQVMLHEADVHELSVIVDTDERVTLETPYGFYSFAAANGNIIISVSATMPDRLFMLKESLVEHMEHFMPDVAAALRWSDAEKAGGLPPNFHFTTVVSIDPVGASFIRVRVRIRDLSSFQDDAIHFRVVLPPEGLDHVEWPYVAENGKTVWPKGEKALHRPVYTARQVDHAAGEMDFDVFLHDGGRATDWARSAAVGARVAVVGPGGGGVPDTRNILMYADETAFPAVARILDALPDNAQGQVTLLAEQGAGCSYPLTAPAGISVTWLSPADGKNLVELALVACKQFPDYFLWFACEKADVQKVRAAYKADGGAPSKSYIAAYWSQP